MVSYYAPPANLVSFTGPNPTLSIVEVPIFTHLEDYEGIRIAAANLAQDLSDVTCRHSRTFESLNIQYRNANGHGPQHSPESPHSSEPEPFESFGTCIIIGCIDKSPHLQKLEDDGKIDFTRIRGQREVFMIQVVENPDFYNYDLAIVIAGSDKRGAIYGVYTLSEQIGKSP